MFSKILCFLSKYTFLHIFFCIDKDKLGAINEFKLFCYALSGKLNKCLLCLMNFFLTLIYFFLSDNELVKINKLCFVVIITCMLSVNI